MTSKDNHRHDNQLEFGFICNFELLLPIKAITIQKLVAHVKLDFRLKYLIKDCMQSAFFLYLFASSHPKNNYKRKRTQGSKGMGRKRTESAEKEKKDDDMGRKIDTKTKW